VVALVEQNPDARLDLGRVQGKLLHLIKSADPVVREAAVRLAGLGGGVVAPSVLLPLCAPAPADGGEAAPRVREAALTALGRLVAAEAEPVLLAAMDDADPAIHERAAEALLALGGRRALERLLEYVSDEEDAAARAGIAARLALPPVDAAHFLPLVDAALTRLAPDDAATEALINLKLRLYEDKSGAAGAPIDDAIVALFPTYARLQRVRGFQPLDKSLRTAESLYRSAASLGEVDHAPPIMLWMKCLEGYVHAWLAPRLIALQRDPAELGRQVDRLLAEAWGPYQSFLQERWPDPVSMGTMRVEVPLRSAPNALREFQERRPKRVESPLSVTEWARLMLFFAVDHPSGVKNVLKVSSRGAVEVARLAHKLQTLAAVRNAVTHRTTAGAATVEAFRRAYYQTFEELTRLA
jgi:hypothetical protein